MKIYTTKKVCPKRNRTTIKKIVKQEMKRARINHEAVRLFAYVFIGSKEYPEYKLLIGISKNGVWTGDKVEIIVKGTNAHRLCWLLSNKYKKDKLAKSVGKECYGKLKKAKLKGSKKK